MPALPLILSLLLALVLCGPLVSFLTDGGHLRSNYRDEMLPCPLGLLIPAAALAALVPLALLAGLFDLNTLDLVGLPLVLGVIALGIADDAFAGSARGWRGHGGAALSGAFSTGALKAYGTLGLALAWCAVTQDGIARFLLASLVIVLATNLFNLFDLRPGRSVKVFVLVGVGCTPGASIHSSALASGSVRFSSAARSICASAGFLATAVQMSSALLPASGSYSCSVQPGLRLQPQCSFY